MFSLSAPWALALTPLPFLLWWSASWRIKKKKRKSKQKSPEHYILHPHTDLLNTLQNESINKRKLPWTWFVGCLLLLLALTKPQWIDTKQANNYQGHQMVLAIDTSGSMQALDFINKSKQNKTLTDRLSGVKKTVQHFINERRGDHIGLIIFADDVFIQSPITSDLSLLQDLSSEIKQGIAGEKTALGDAIAVAVQQLKNTEKKSRLLILFTDGSNTAGNISPENAILLAQNQGVRIYTIGIGSTTAANTEKGVFFSQGPIAKPIYTQLPLNSGLLQKIANETGGSYYQANDSNTLTNIIHDIDQLEPIRLKTQQNIHAKEYFWLPLLLGLSLLIFNEFTSRAPTISSCFNFKFASRKTTLP